jgi:phenylacetate-CoA ligase
MEAWTFPPRFDAGYLPPADSRYWFPDRETMPPAARDRAILERLQALTRYAWEHAPFYRRKWDEAGFHPDRLRSLEDFETKVPVIAKRDLRESHARILRGMGLRPGDTVFIAAICSLYMGSWGTYREKPVF